MELFGLLFAAPVAIATSAIYTALAIWAFGPRLKKGALLISYGVVGLIGLEVALLVLIGAKSSFLHLHHAYTILHFTNFLLAPPAIANLVLHFTAYKAGGPWFQFFTAAVSCWIVSMSTLLTNIIIDEAIVGVDAETPFYMTNTEPNQTPEPIAHAVTAAASHPPRCRG